jgi:hypothetical protein
MLCFASRSSHFGFIAVECVFALPGSGLWVFWLRFSLKKYFWTKVLFFQLKKTIFLNIYFFFWFLICSKNFKDALKFHLDLSLTKFHTALQKIVSPRKKWFMEGTPFEFRSDHKTHAQQKERRNFLQRPRKHIDMPIMQNSVRFLFHNWTYLWHVYILVDYGVHVDFCLFYGVIVKKKKNYSHQDIIWAIMRRK